MNNPHDLISRKAAIEETLKFCPEKTKPGSFDEYGATVLYGVIDVILKQLPAADAAPVVHARWHELKDGTEECTNCLGLCPYEENYNGDVIFNFGCEYCPWCGAKMDGERRDDDAAN